MSIIMFWYFSIIMAWAMYYVVASFREVVPWSLCGQWWNTLRCTDLLSRALNDTAANSSSSFLNVTMAWTNHTSEALSVKSTDTQTNQYCQQIILCSPPPQPLLVYSFLFSSSLCCCYCCRCCSVCVWGGGGGI